MHAPRALLVGLTTLGLLAGITPPAHADTGTDAYIVQFKSTISASAVAPSLLGADAKVLTNVRAAIAQLSAAKAAALASNPNVKSVRKKSRITASGQTTAPWDLDLLDNRTGATDTTYNYPNAGTGVTVYVIDSGLVPTHSEFASANILAGKNYVQASDPTTACGKDKPADTTVNPTDTLDQLGHGTAVSSLIVGAKDGVAKAATIVPVRVLDCDGGGSSFDVASAADWIIQQHTPGAPAVVNMSFGAGEIVSELDAATQALLDHGITVVAAAGNSNVDACTSSPGSVPGAITAAAVTAALAEPVWPDGQGTNFGRCVDLYAPGDKVVVADWKVLTNGSRSADGTSFSAPLTAGAAAQVLADHPAWTPAQVSADLSARAAFGVVTNARSVNKLLHVGPLGPYEAFVTAAYQDFLGRLPSGAEVSIQAQALASGAVPKSSFLNSLATSNEWLATIVTKLYKDTLGREPEAAGLSGWTARLRSGQYTVAQAAGLFYASEEYYLYHAGGTPTSWVTNLYQKILLREPDSGGLQQWVAFTNNPSLGRAFVAYNFYQSMESRRQRVQVLYQALLKRDPDPTGWPYWADQVFTSGDITLAINLTMSAEYWIQSQERY